jgi:hypothetical protein
MTLGPLKTWLGGLVDTETFVGKVCVARPQTSKEVLLQDITRWQESIDPVHGPHCDPYSNQEGWHDYGCKFLDDPDLAVCPVQERENCERRLANLDGDWYMPECFGNPLLAAQQKSLMLKYEEPLI